MLLKLNSRKLLHRLYSLGIKKFFFLKKSEFHLHDNSYYEDKNVDALELLKYWYYKTPMKIMRKNRVS